MTSDDTQSASDLAASALADVQDAEVAVDAATSSPSQMAEALNHLQAVIERNVEQLDQVEEELKLERQTLKNIVENDTEISKNQEAVEEATQQLKQRKSQVMASPEVLQAKSTIGELSERANEIKQALNTHLLNLYKITGAKVIDFSNGDQREFEVKANVKRKKV